MITNHGYGGVNIPFGGAPDTGGQNVYVNAYARALDNLGYKVTIYARGGFPFYESQKSRVGSEMLTPFVRYVYVPGGGDEFIRKEDISIAIIEELEWIYRQIQEESKLAGVLPWEYYVMINSHYWDAGILATSLVIKWQNDLCCAMIHVLTEGLVDEEEFDVLKEDRHLKAISKSPAIALGQLLLEFVEGSKYAVEEEQVEHAFNFWTERSPLAVQVEEGPGKHIDWLNLRSTIAAATPQLRPLVLARVLGKAILDEPIRNIVFRDRHFKSFRTYHEMETFHDLLDNAMHHVNKHVWTPHSLGVIKEWNFRDKSVEVKRELKFRERRSHERVICDYTRAFGATSYEIAKGLVTNYGVEIDQVLFYPPGVDKSIFHEYSNGDVRTLESYLASQTGLLEEVIRSSTVFFETSRMDVTKRKDVLLKAFEELVRRGHKDCLFFIGGGPENAVYNELKSIVDTSPDLKGRMFLLGFIPDDMIPILFNYADVYVSASEMEGFGMSVAQAAFDAVPIVSSNKIPFTTFYLPDEAIIVDAGNVEGFADGMEQLLLSEQERADRGKRSKEKAMVLEWERLTAKFIADLNKLNFDIPITKPISNTIF